MKKKVWIGLGVAALIITFVTVGVLKQLWSKETVTVTKLGTHNLQESFTTSGVLKAGNQQTVYYQAERGELKKVWVKPGQQVKKGDRLVEYENPQLRAEKEQMEMQIKSAEIRLNSLYRQRKNLNASQGEHEGAGEGVPSMQSSKEELNQQIRLAQLELDQAKEQMKLVKERINHLVITSKISGTVVQVDEQAGNALNMNNPIVVVADLNEFHVTANVSEYDVMKVKEGQSVTLQSDALPDQKWTGEVKRVAYLPKQNQLDEAAGNGGAQVVYPIEIKVNEAIPLKIGSKMIVEITISTQQIQGLPQEAIVEQNNETFVYVVENGKAVKKTVKIGKRNDRVVEILSGISPQDQVIVSPPEGLTPGMEVTVK